MVTDLSAPVAGAIPEVRRQVRGGAGPAARRCSMHEMGIASSVLDIVRQYVPEAAGAPRPPGARAGRQTGRRRTESLTFCFEAIVAGTPLRRRASRSSRFRSRPSAGSAAALRRQPFFACAACGSPRCSADRSEVSETSWTTSSRAIGVDDAPAERPMSVITIERQGPREERRAGAAEPRALPRATASSSFNLVSSPGGRQDQPAGADHRRTARPPAGRGDRRRRADRLRRAAGGPLRRAGGAGRDQRRLPPRGATGAGRADQLDLGDTRRAGDRERRQSGLSGRLRSGRGHEGGGAQHHRGRRQAAEVPGDVPQRVGAGGEQDRPAAVTCPATSRR